MPIAPTECSFRVADPYGPEIAPRPELRARALEPSQGEWQRDDSCATAPSRRRSPRPMARPPRMKPPRHLPHHLRAETAARRSSSTTATGERFLACPRRNHVAAWLALPLPTASCRNHYPPAPRDFAGRSLRGHAPDQQRYALWFNRKHGFDGHLFQGRFHSDAAPEHLALARARALHRAEPGPGGMRSRAGRDWAWSSYRAALGLRRRPRLFLDARLDPRAVRRRACERAAWSFPTLRRRRAISEP